VVSPINLFLYVRHFSGIRDIAEQILKLTMNADKCSLRMISFFWKKWTETPVKQGKNTWQIGNYICL
jgi:hypothetical protein